MEEVMSALVHGLEFSRRDGGGVAVRVTVVGTDDVVGFYERLRQACREYHAVRHEGREEELRVAVGSGAQPGWLTWFRIMEGLTTLRQQELSIRAA